MKTTNLILFVALLTLFSCQQQPKFSKPPLADVKPVSEKYFGKEVTDPYRYMEDVKDSSALKWIKTQSEYARKVLDNIPGRQELLNKMKEFDKRKTTSIYNLQITDNDYYFYLKQTPTDETGKLFYRVGFTGTEKLLFDPLHFGKDTTQKFVISAFYPSRDGSKLGIEIAPNGSESAILYMMDVATQKMLSEKIDRVWYSGVSWLPDGKTFFYSRLQSADVHNPDREKDSKVFVHTLGNDPAADIEFFSRTKNPELHILPEEFTGVYYDKDCQYLFANVSTVNNSLKIYMAPVSEMNKKNVAWKQLFNLDDQVYNFWTTEKEIYAYTPKNAPNFKIVKMPIANPDLNKAETVVPESKDEVIKELAVNSNGLYYVTTKNGVIAKLYKKLFTSPSIEQVKLPVNAGTLNISIKGAKFKDLWVYTAGWANTTMRYRYEESTGKFTEEYLSTIAKYPEYENLVVDEVEIPGKDGQMVPLSLIYNKTIKKDGSNPVFLYGYGAYGMTMDPYFSPNWLLWTVKGGILAVAHVRGGGEKGDQWYKGGQKTTKHNTWQDLIASAEYLIKEQYTSKGKIAINGGSAGGILIGRAMTERPDLFAAAIPEVGCLNALRMEMEPNGPVNAPEFGTMKDSVECMALIEMDAYLHVKDSTQYPAALITAGINDPRVIYWQPAKFAARLMAANASGKPVLLFTDYSAGHGMGNTKSKSFSSLADKLSFAFWQTGHPEFQLKNF